MSDSSTNASVPTPSNTCMQHACKIAMVEDRPIMMDYFADSHENNILIGVKESGEKLLVKNEDEYTSPITKIYKVESEYIILTENSIYITSVNVQTRRIN